MVALRAIRVLKQMVSSEYWSTLVFRKEATVEDNSRLSYFFLGMGIGVAVGILFAPKSGEETRRIIRDRADEGRGYVKRRSEELRDSASDLVEKGRGAASDLVEKGKGAVKSQKDQISAAVEAGKSAYKDAVSDPGEPAEAGPEGV